jgi:hypothetical protein
MFVPFREGPQQSECDGALAHWPRAWHIAKSLALLLGPEGRRDLGMWGYLVWGGYL